MTVTKAPTAAQNTAQATTVANQAAGALALNQDVLAELAKAAKDAAALERPSVGKISLKAGVMSYQGNLVPGNTLPVVVLFAAYRNTFYTGRYDPNNLMNPKCFSLASGPEGMVPHENVSEPEHDTCTGCARSEWGSDLNGGRGKACKETRRLILLPASALDDVDNIKSAELAILDVPVTSVKNYANFVNILNTALQLPMWAAVTQVGVVPDAKTQFKVTFTPLRPVPDMGILNALKSRIDDAKRIAMTPYDETASSDDPVPEPKVASKKF